MSQRKVREVLGCVCGALCGNVTGSIQSRAT